MVDRPLIIIHGWSDNAASFEPLAQFLARSLHRPITHITLADYVSMDDAVTFTDLAMALQHAWIRHGLSLQPRSNDVVVHSTGGLIIRDWMTRFFAPGDVPIHHLVMLAPANFGSPIAHKGKSFIGRVLKGFTSEKAFHVGASLLEGLELASPFAWDLALRDRFGAEAYDGPGRVLATVLVGNSGFSGIAAAANTEGSDGVVRASTANLNASLLRADFTNPLEPTSTLTRALSTTAFAVIPEENHSSIALKEQGGFRNPITGTLICNALTVSDERFDAWSASLTQRTPGYQNTVFRVHDQHGNAVHDYFLEFYVEDDDRNWFAEMFHRDAIRTVHAHSKDSSLRSALVDCAALFEQVDKDWEAMTFSLTAQPDIDRNGNVGFRTFRDQDMNGIRIPRKFLRTFFQPHRTLLVDVTLRREQREQLVQLHTAHPPRPRA